MRVGGRAEVAIKIDAAQPPLESAHFLIANARLESSISDSKERRVRISNRERIAISKSEK
jgi:hypothetical protein